MSFSTFLHNTELIIVIFFRVRDLNFIREKSATNTKNRKKQQIYATHISAVLYFVFMPNEPYLQFMFSKEIPSQH